MRTNKLKITIITVLGFLGFISAQDNNFIFVEQTRNMSNPAFAGVENNSVLRVGGQSGWSDTGNQYLVFSTNLSDRVGIGANISREKIFVQKNTSVFADFSYNIPIQDDAKLYFGIKAGGDFYSVDASNLKAYNDDGSLVTQDKLLQSYTNKFSPNVGVGINYTTPKFFAGIGVPRLLVSDETQLDALNRVIKAPNRFSVNFISGYSFNLSEEFKAKPYVYLAYREAQKARIELATSLSYDDLIEAGVSYRMEEFLNLFTKVEIPKTNLQLGYGYRVYLSGLSDYMNNSYEIMLQYAF